MALPCLIQMLADSLRWPGCDNLQRLWSRLAQTQRCRQTKPNSRFSSTLSLQRLISNHHGLPDDSGHSEQCGDCIYGHVGQT